MKLISTSEFETPPTLGGLRYALELFVANHPNGTESGRPIRFRTTLLGEVQAFSVYELEEGEEGYIGSGS